jgi:hypothetical protein
MNLNYTRLGVLLIRIQAILIIAESISGVLMAIPLLAQGGFDASKYGVPNYAISLFLRPIVGLLLFAFSIPIAQKALGFLDAKKE